jgi:hypothetical protein
MQYVYHINLDERGEFYADVRHPSSDETMIEIKGHDIFETGYMAHKEDMEGLTEWLQHIHLIREDDEVVMA